MGIRLLVLDAITFEMDMIMLQNERLYGICKSYQRERFQFYLLNSVHRENTRLSDKSKLLIHDYGHAITLQKQTIIGCEYRYQCLWNQYVS